MKRIISLLMAFILCAIFIVPTFAVDNKYNTGDIYDSENTLFKDRMSSPQVSAQIKDDLHKLEKVGILSDMCHPSRITSSGAIEYTVDFSDTISDKITIYENDNKDLTINFYEGNTHTVLQFLSDGRLSVNGGKAVPYKATEIYYTPSLRGSSSGPLRMSNVEYSLSPFGPASSYTLYCGTYSGTKCSWGVATLVGLATGAVATIICAAVNAGLALSLGASIFSGVAAALITRCEIYGMDDAYYSWQFEKYERTDSMSIDRYYKYTGACYSRKNLAGTAYPHTYYYHKWFS